jgi:HlyD family secretion protein
MKRSLLSLLAVAVTGGAAFFAWSRLHAGSHAVKYTTAVATIGDVVATVTATGQLQPVVSVQVGSQVSGLIKELKVDFNSPVQAGQVIARLDDASFIAALHSAEGNLAAARSDLHAAQLTATRNHDLFAQHMVPQSDVDTSDAAVEKGQANVIIAQANLERARLDLSHCTVTSPVDGIVTSRNVDVGQTVAASLSAPTLFTIAADLTKMQIVAEVAEGDIGQVRAGKKVNFTVDAYPGRTFSGTVAQVRYAPRTIDNVVNYDTVINVANDDLALLPGMTASTSIVIAEHHDAVLVPNAALRLHLAADAPGATGAGRGTRPPTGAGKSGPGTGATARDPANSPRTLYTLADTPAAVPDPHRVRAGISDGQKTEILSGIANGDRIVVAAVGSAPGASARSTSPLSGGGGYGGFR